MPHSRYHGWTMGERATRSSSERPRACAGATAPRIARRASTRISPIATARPSVWTADLTESASTSRSRWASWPRPRPMSLVTESAVWMFAATPCVCSQPKPVPLTRVAPPATAQATRPGARRPLAQRRQAGPVAAACTRTPMNRSATAAGDFTIMARPIRALPTIHLPRRARTDPASIRPIISPSLWIPPITCIRSSGLRAPSHRARLSLCPCSAARRRRDQTIRTREARATSRRPRTAGTIVPPVALATAAESSRKRGP